MLRRLPQTSQQTQQYSTPTRLGSTGLTGMRARLDPRLRNHRPRQHWRKIRRPPDPGIGPWATRMQAAQERDWTQTKNGTRPSTIHAWYRSGTRPSTILPRSPRSYGGPARYSLAAARFDRPSRAAISQPSSGWLQQSRFTRVVERTLRLPSGGPLPRCVSPTSLGLAPPSPSPRSVSPSRPAGTWLSPGRRKEDSRVRRASSTVWWRKSKSATNLARPRRIMT